MTFCLPESRWFKVVRGLGVLCLASVVLGFVLPAHTLHAHVVLSGSMEPSVPTGSLAITHGLSLPHYKVGDVISFHDPTHPRTIILHRIVNISRNAHGVVEVHTKGDANTNGDPFPLTGTLVEGKLLFSLPRLGYVVHGLTTTTGFLGVAAVTFLFCVFREVRYVLEVVFKARSA